MKRTIYIVQLGALLSVSATAQTTLTLDDCRALAIENNINIATAQRNVDMAREQKSEAFTNYFPNISAMGAAAWFNEDLVMPGLDNFKFAGVTAIQPLFMGGQIVRANKLATIGIEAGETAREQLNDAGEQLLIVMDKNWIAVEDAYRLLQLAQQSIQQSEENLRLYQDYYRAGTSAMSDVLDAQQSFQQAHDSFVAAYADYQTKITEYKISTGIY